MASSSLDSFLDSSDAAAATSSTEDGCSSPPAAHASNGGDRIAVPQIKTGIFSAPRKGSGDAAKSPPPAYLAPSVNSRRMSLGLGGHNMTEAERAKNIKSRPSHVHHHRQASAESRLRSMQRQRMLGETSALGSRSSANLRAPLTAGSGAEKGKARRISSGSFADLGGAGTLAAGVIRAMPV